jgi:hypothetical protein
LAAERCAFRKANGLPAGPNLATLCLSTLCLSTLCLVANLSTIYLVDDDSSIISIFEATQAEQVEQFLDPPEQASLAANVGRQSARKAHEAQMASRNAHIEAGRKAALAVNKMGRARAMERRQPKKAARLCDVDTHR